MNIETSAGPQAVNQMADISDVCLLFYATFESPHEKETGKRQACAEVREQTFMYTARNEVSASAHSSLMLRYGTVATRLAVNPQEVPLSQMSQESPSSPCAYAKPQRGHCR